MLLVMKTANKTEYRQ